MMQPAKSCFTCQYGGTERGTNCKIASDRLCCDDWTEQVKITVRAVVDFEIDLKAYEEYYQEKVNDLSDLAKLERTNKLEFFRRRLHFDDELNAVKIETVQRVEAIA